LDRTHWSLFPVVFKGRCLPLDAYDELMGILAHGCVGELIDPKLVFYEKAYRRRSRCDDLKVVYFTVR
jgi:hypothetical protein